MSGRGSRFAFAALFGAGLAAAGCMTPTGAWSDQGFAQTTFGWRASYAPGTTALLGPDWRLDNWVVDADGTMIPKHRGAYVASDEEESNQDPAAHAERHRIFVYDLKYVNVRNNGVIWAQTRRVHARDADRDLDVLLANYADSLAGTGLYEQGSVFGVAAVKARSFTTFVTDRQPLKLGPHPAISAVIELAETERLRVDPNARTSKIAIAITKFRYLEKAGSASEALIANADSGQSQHEAVMVDNQVYYRRTAVMLVGYYNDADHFAPGLNDFTTLRDRIQWPNPIPMEAQGTPTVPTVEPAPPPPPAPPIQGL